MSRTLFAAVLAVELVCMTQVSGDPTTQPMSVPASSGTPTSAMHQLLRAIDNADRSRALACVQTAGADELQVAESQVDLMLAVSKLKKAIRTKNGFQSPAYLPLNVVEEVDCASIDVKVKGDAATVFVNSNDPPMHSHCIAWCASKGHGNCHLPMI